MREDEWGAAGPKPAAGEERAEMAAGTRVLQSLVDEQRRARRWGIFFKALFALYAGVLLWLMGGWGVTEPADEPHAALVELSGMILEDGAGSAEHTVAALRRAFANEAASGVVLRINSPGGSPVQARYIYEEIRRLKAAHPDKPLYAVATDVCASGGYYVAVAADGIYASGSSIVGSIGVRMDSFGLVEAMRRLGVERRLYTAGEHKGFLDPFQPEKALEVRHVQNVLDNVHQQFIAAVRTGRGARLADDPSLFSGLFWSGEQSLELGLIDGLGSVRSVAQEKLGAERIVDYTVRPAFLERFTEQVGVAVTQALESRLGTATVLR